MLAVFLGRLIRFTARALLVIRYGPQIVTLIHDLARQHLSALLIGIGAVFAVLIVLALRKGIPGIRRKAGGGGKTVG